MYHPKMLCVPGNSAVARDVSAQAVVDGHTAELIVGRLGGREVGGMVVEKLPVIGVTRCCFKKLSSGS
jgi:hypothetical protein